MKFDKLKHVGGLFARNWLWSVIVGIAGTFAVYAILHLVTPAARRDRESRLYPISGCKNEERLADVIFVHGLDGDYETAWHQKGRPDAFFPKLLAEDFPNVGVWSFDYPAAKFVATGGTMPIIDRAKNFLSSISVNDIGVQRPIVFITHSLGGLVVKQALRTGAESVLPQWQSIPQMTKGVVFIATPNAGARIANFLEYWAGKYTTVTVQELRNDNPSLQELKEWYVRNVDKFQIETLVFYEKKKTGPILVVGQGEADPGLARDIEMIPLDENHSSICKPKSKEESLMYRVVARHLAKWLKTEPATVKRPGSPPEELMTLDLTDDGSVKIELALLPADEFQFGRRIQDKVSDLIHLFPVEAMYRDDFEREIYPAEKVVINEPFYMGVKEITREQFRAFTEVTDYDKDETADVNPTGAEPLTKREMAEYGFKNPRDDHPETWVTLKDARSFCNWMTDQTGFSTRLPTEQEWEYACRANQQEQMRYSHTNDPNELEDYANLFNPPYELQFDLEFLAPFPAPPSDGTGFERYTPTLTIALPLGTTRFVIKDSVPTESQEKGWLWNRLSPMSESLFAGFELLPDDDSSDRSSTDVTIENKTDFDFHLHDVNSHPLRLNATEMETIRARRVRSPTEVIFETHGWIDDEWRQLVAYPGSEIAFFYDEQGRKGYALSFWRRPLSANEITIDAAPDIGDSVLFRHHNGEQGEERAVVAGVQLVRGISIGISTHVPWHDGYPGIAPVGRFEKNAFGLADMHGNVWEWCDSVYDGPPPRWLKDDHVKPLYVLRGGCYM